MTERGAPEAVIVPADNVVHVRSGLQVRLFSFGYLWHHGDYPRTEVTGPCEALIDLRQLLYNPFKNPAMRELTGLDTRVRDYVLTTAGAAELIAAVTAFAAQAARQATDRGRLVQIGFGCAGGRHRSVVLANEVRRLLNQRGIGALAVHYDVRRPVYQPPTATTSETSTDTTAP